MLPAPPSPASRCRATHPPPVATRHTNATPDKATRARVLPVSLSSPGNLTAKGRSIGEQVTSTETPPGATPPPDPGLSHRMYLVLVSLSSYLKRGRRGPYPPKTRNDNKKPRKTGNPRYKNRGQGNKDKPGYQHKETRGGSQTRLQGQEPLPTLSLRSTLPQGSRNPAPLKRGRSPIARTLTLWLPGS
jgi:hypothetical protein